MSTSPRAPHSILVTTLSGVALACGGGGGGGGDTPDSGGGTIDAAPRYDARPLPDSAPNIDADTGDGNDSFDEAKTIIEGVTVGGEGAIDVPGDLDYYTFAGTAGQWMHITVTANEDDDPDLLDTVITLYDASENQIAQNDDAIPRVNSDSELIVRLPATGDYYLMIQDYSTWKSETPEGGADFTYDIDVMELEDMVANGIEINEELTENAPNSALFKDNQVILVGTFEDDTDIDIFGFSMPGSGNRMASTSIYPGGIDGNGSTSSAGTVWITDVNETVILGRVDTEEGPERLAPPIDGGANYRIFIQHPGGGLGANDYYVIKLHERNDNTEEAEASSGANDTLGSAEALSMNDDGTANRGFIIAWLDPTTTDVDYFSFPATAGDTVSVACIGARAGSAVRDLTVEVRNPSDTVVSSTTETLLVSPYLTDVPLSETGTHAIRLSAASEDVDVDNSFVRCGVHVVTP